MRVLAALAVAAVAVASAAGLWLLRPPPRPGDVPMPRTLAGIPQGHVYTGYLEQPDSLNPFTTRSGVARRYVLGFTHETLVDVDPVTGEPRGALATGWEVAPAGDEVVFTLRENVQFCDGTPLRPEDVLYTWEVVQRGAVFGSIGDGVGLVREATVEPGPPPRLRVRLHDPHPAAALAVGESWIVAQRRWFEQQLAAAAARRGIAPDDADDRFGELLAGLTDEPGPGTGPYRLAVWHKGEDLLLQRNENGWQRHARPGTWNLGGIRLCFAADGAAAFAALVQRRIDFYQAADVDAVLRSRPELADDYRKVVYDPVGANTYVVEWNLHHPQLQDARVRRALGMLFDRQAIVTNLFAGNAVPATCLAKPGSPEYPDDLEPLPFDPAAARRLLRGSGHDSANDTQLRVRLLVPAEFPVLSRIGDLAVAAAAAADVDLQVDVLTFETLMQRRDAGEWDGVLLLRSFRGWIDPAPMFHSTGAANLMGFADATVDDLLERSRAAADRAIRADLLRQVHRRIHELQPLATLVHPRLAMLLNAHIANAEPGPLGLWPERFYVPFAHQR